MSTKIDKTIKRHVNRNVGNLQQAFRLASFELGLTKKQVESRWYNKLMASETVFTTYGKYALKNRKVLRKNSKINATKIRGDKKAELIASIDLFA